MRLPSSSWPSPNAVEVGLSAVGQPLDSRMMIQRSAAEVPDRSRGRPDPWIEPRPPGRVDRAPSAARAARRLASSSWRIRRRSSAERLRRAAPASLATRASSRSLACRRTARTRSTSATWARTLASAATRARSALTMPSCSWTARTRATSSRRSTSWSALITQLRVMARSSRSRRSLAWTTTARPAATAPASVRASLGVGGHRVGEQQQRHHGGHQRNHPRTTGYRSGRFIGSTGSGGLL
jgi:hypothetical protein